MIEVTGDWQMCATSLLYVSIGILCNLYSLLFWNCYSVTICSIFYLDDINQTSLHQSLDKKIQVEGFTASTSFVCTWCVTSYPYTYYVKKKKLKKLFTFLQKSSFSRADWSQMFSMKKKYLKRKFYHGITSDLLKLFYHWNEKTIETKCVYDVILKTFEPSIVDEDINRAVDYEMFILCFYKVILW